MFEGRDVDYDTICCHILFGCYGWRWSTPSLKDAKGWMKDLLVFLYMVFNEIGRFEFIYGLSCEMYTWNVYLISMVNLEDLDPGFVDFLLQML